MAQDLARIHAQGSPAGVADGRPVDGLIEELIAAWNAHDLDRVMACYDPAYEGTDIGEAATRQGAIAVRKMVRRWFRAFPDLRLERETLIVEGDRAALGWRLHATHQGSFMRIPPTTLRKTSSCANDSPARLSSTASRSASRRPSNPVATRCGVPKPAFAASA